MRRISSAQIAQKWADKTAGATDQLKAGVMAVTTAPSQAAIAQAQVWIDKLNEAFRNNVWQEALNRVTLNDWQQAMINKGIPVIADRVRKAIGKYQTFIESYMNWFRNNVQPQLDGSPRGSLETNIARATLVIRASASMRGQFRRGRYQGG